MLNKLAIAALSQAAAWRRWERKEPQNRVIRPRIRNKDGNVVGYQAPSPLPEPPVPSHFYSKESERWRPGRTVLREEPCLRQVIDDYRAARHPAPEEKSVRSLSLSREQIDKLIRK